MTAAALPDHLDEIIRRGVLAVEARLDQIERDNRTPAERDDAIITTAVRRLVELGLITPCSREEFEAKTAGWTRL